MPTLLSVCRLLFLLSVAAVMLFTATGVDSSAPKVNLPCCFEVTHPIKISPFSQCYEQKPREDCPIHAFLVKGPGSDWYCISPDTRRLLKLKSLKKINCTSIFG